MPDPEKSIRKQLNKLNELLVATPVDAAAGRATVGALRDALDQLLEDRKPRAQLSARLWSEALLAQAREDLQAVDILVSGPASVMVMLLQMYFEKLAKAALARTDVQTFNAHRTSHTAASRLVANIKNQNRYLELRYEWKDMLALVEAIEGAHPALAKRGPHLEYPWELGNRMGLPSQDLTIVLEFSNPRNLRGAKLLRFAHELSNRFDEIFA